MTTQLKLSIPNDWSEITTKQYTDYISSVSQEDTDEEHMAKLLLHFCSLKGNVVKHLKIKDLTKIQSILKQLILKPISQDIINKIDIDGVIYGFHPNLDEMTMGEFVDLDSHAKEHNLSKMLGVLYRPIVEDKGNRYTIESYSFEKHGQNYLRLEKLSINIANAVAVFFWSLGSKLLDDSITYSNQVKVEEQNPITDGSQY